jgi:hypothetical protein
VGYWKNRKIVEDDRGWFFAPDRWVCCEHVDDTFLRERMQAAAEENRCDYCGREDDDGEAIACALDVLVDACGEVLRSRYDTVENEGLPWDQEVGDYFGSYSDAEDLLNGGLGLFDDWVPEELVLDILGCFPMDIAWCERNYFRLNPQQALSAGWEEFCATVKHQSRYVFLVEDGPVEDDDYDGVPVSRMLERLGELIEREGLLCPSPAGTPWARARRTSPGEVFASAGALGTTPVEYATQPNRMSPSGIPMFYGASDEATALTETVPDGEPATVAIFKTTTELLLLKLSDLPALPSIFDIDQLPRWYALRFLQEFAKDLSKPIQRDGREHIEYVPTQIVTEFFRRVFRNGAGTKLGGIIYPSSVCEGESAVLFVENHQCADSVSGQDTLLRLVEVKHPG